MNAETEISKATAPSQIDQAHIWRSRLLDAFASLESNVAKLLARSEKNLASDAAPLGQKIEALKQLKTNPPLTKNCPARLAKICAELAPFLNIRSDIVHAKLAVCVCDGVLHAKFCNTMNSDKPYPELRMFTFEDFDTMNKEIRRLSNQLNSIITPPSSPPPPKQGAASGL